VNADRPLRIGLNLLYLVPGVVGGTETYARSLVGALAGLDGEEDYRLYVNEETADAGLFDGLDVEVVPCAVRAASRPARYAYEQLRLPRRLRRDDIDLLHSLGYVGPLVLPCPHVVTIHDLIYVGFRDHMSARRRHALRLFVRATARRAARVITVSESSRRELMDDIGLDRARVTVIHEASRDVDPASLPADPTVVERYGLADRYIVAFSSLSPSKNIASLVDAYAEIASEVVESLVLIGHLPPDSGVRAQIDALGLGNRVTVTGWVPDDDVLPLIGRAALFAFPSLYEGFGLPVLDAQAMGVPVVCSSAASLPEVAGSGALFVDPRSVSDMADGLRRVLADDELRSELVIKGRANVDRFSWHQAAVETQAVYREVATS
jgi:glycosyltransferase involved in cell wall biosynthesis